MRTARSFFGSLLAIAVVGAIAWLLGLGEVVRSSVAAGHVLDWIMGAICLFWLVVVLTVPWDLYFQAHTVAFELERARERGIVPAPGREEYLHVLRRRLGWIAIGAHLLSAAIVAAVTFFSGGAVGYYFAAFYVVSTAFRPAAAAYVYLSGRLRAIGEEARYPREDVVDVRDRLAMVEGMLKAGEMHLEQWQRELAAERKQREAETRELRQGLHAMGREFEATVSRLTDNQDVIRGIQAFVRLVGQSGQA